MSDELITLYPSDSNLCHRALKQEKGIKSLTIAFIAQRGKLCVEMSSSH